MNTSTTTEYWLQAEMENAEGWQYVVKADNPQDIVDLIKRARIERPNRKWRGVMKETREYLLKE